MNEGLRVSVPRWFWVSAAVALLWNLMGCMIFLSEVFAKEAMMESFTEEQKEWSRAIPFWIYVVFAVVSGVAAALPYLNGIDWLSRVLQPVLLPWSSKWATGC